MFDSPFEYCVVCQEYVLLDQTRRECGREHSCAAVSKCPLERLFTGMDFRERQGAPKDEESTAIGVKRHSQCPPSVTPCTPASRGSNISVKR